MQTRPLLVALIGLAMTGTAALAQPGHQAPPPPHRHYHPRHHSYTHRPLPPPRHDEHGPDAPHR